MPTVHDDVDNIRVTYIPANERPVDKNWAGCGVIRVQAYRQNPAESRSLHLGAEFPVPDAAAFTRLIETLLNVYQRGTA
jgi:hypothetical protein